MPGIQFLLNGKNTTTDVEVDMPLLWLLREEFQLTGTKFGCGIAINPDIVKTQMQGGIAYGLSAALREAVTLVGGEVQETNFHQYRSLRINEMPQVEVHIMASSEPPSGVGEPGVPPLAPALSNALLPQPAYVSASCRSATS